MNIFIVILNWNRAKDTIECLESVSKLNLANHKLSVIVVDNASSDDSVQKIEKKLKILTAKNKFTSEVIQNDKNLGFAAGNNVGINHALKHNPDYIMLLNNDTVVDSNLLVGLLKTVKRYKRAGLISPKIYFAKGYEFHTKRYKSKDIGKVIWYAGGNFDWDNIYGTNRGADEVDKGQYEKVEETDFATGACMLVKAEAVEKVGMFDKQYYMYLEDVDLSHRMKKAGWKVLYTPHAHLWHKVAQSSKIGGKLNDYFITRNRLLFGMRYANFRTRLALYRESLRLFRSGREWQRKGVIDYYLGRLGKGSWNRK